MFQAILACAAMLAGVAPAFAATPTLLWGDDFNQPDGTGPDQTKWVYDVGEGLWGNGELEDYSNSRANSYVISDPDALDGKALVIAALKDPIYGTITSARLQTATKFQTTYGHIEARLKTTSSQGMWPAFWMLGSDIYTGVNWPDCGEIDILETIDASTILYGTLHGPGYSVGAQSTLPGSANYSQAYHVFAVDWEPNQIQWSVDGKVYQTVVPTGGGAGVSTIPAGDQWVFNNSPFFILINLAVGGTWPGNPDSTTVYPALYTIDYVHVYGIPPTVPTGGTASAAGSNVVNLSWTAPSDLKGFTLTGYQVTRALDSGFTQAVDKISVGPSASFADATVSGGVTYYYAVAAVSTGGVSDPSAAFSVSTPEPLPAIIVPPGGQVLNSGSTLVLTTISAPGITYQWSFIPQGSTVAQVLSDTPLDAASDIVSGSNGPQLVIANATSASAGTYTVTAQYSDGSNATSAPALVSVTQSPNPGFLVNISSRAFVGTGANILIGGFYIGGTTSRSVLVQALGPALANEGVPGVLQHPSLAIYNSAGTAIYSDNGWGSGRVLLDAAAAAYAAPVLEPDSGDSEVLLTLPPGGYTAEVSGADGGTGVALCAIYQLP